MAKTKQRRAELGARRDLYQEVTNQVIALLEEGTVPWRKPWTDLGLQRNLQSGRAYRGLNQLLLQVAQMRRGYSRPCWTTYRAAEKAGGQVRRGERGSMVTFWKRIKVDDADNPGKKKLIPLMRAHTVFNVDQVDGIEPPAIEEPIDFEPIAAAEAIVAAMPNPPKITYGGDQALYELLGDRVAMPLRETFSSEEKHYAALFHELVHSTGAPGRLARDELLERSEENYAREELTAELGAAFLCAEAMIVPAVIENSAAYISGWLKHLNDDNRLITVAAGRAQRATDYILGISFDDVDEDDHEENASPASKQHGSEKPAKTVLSEAI